MLVTSPKNYWSGLYENFSRDVSGDKKVTVKFWKSSECGYRKFLIKFLPLRDGAVEQLLWVTREDVLTNCCKFFLRDEMSHKQQTIWFWCWFGSWFRYRMFYHSGIGPWRRSALSESVVDFVSRMLCTQVCKYIKYDMWALACSWSLELDWWWHCYSHLLWTNNTLSSSILWFTENVTAFVFY